MSEVSDVFPEPNVTDRQESEGVNSSSSVSEPDVIDGACSCSSLATKNVATQATTQEEKLDRTLTSALIKGESEVRFDDNEIIFQWAVDLRTAHTSNRCGFQRRFNLPIDGQDVPFVFHIDPVAKEHVSTDQTLATKDKQWAKKKKGQSTFRRPGTYAHMWVRCSDPSMLLADTCCMSVSFTGGGGMLQISESHDFACLPSCNQVVPETPEKLWKFPFDIEKNGVWLVSGIFQSVRRTNRST
jgi:hypothetical protein